MNVPVADKIDSLLATAGKYYPDAELGPVRRGLDLLQQGASAKGSAGRFGVRDALETAGVLAAMRLDPPAIAAALVAERGLSPAELSEQLGEEVAGLVANVSQLDEIRWDRIEEHTAESLRKMFIAMAADIRVVVISLAIRVQRLRGLRDEQGQLIGRDAARAERVARETLDVFAPLANRLGIWQLKWELEDLSLRELEPDTYEDLRQQIQETREQRNAFIRESVRILGAKLAEEGIEASVSGRPKHIYSIFKKMQRKNLDFEQIFDVSAVRIITQQVGDCYAALGLIHSLWVPLPGEFDDYIARPKDNLYQSLHTAVLGPEGRPLEVQIRTQQMHQYAEFGVAAHWAYKESSKLKRDASEKFMVLRQLMNWEEELSDPLQFVESLKTDVFKDQVYVFTPAGDIVDLPVGSTPIDFAYRIHTQVGHRCRGAKVNDQIVPLDYQLKTGDRVSILTQKRPSPSRDWLNPASGYVRTSGARQKVRQWFRAQSRDTSVAAGKEIVEREIGRLSLEQTTIEEVAEALKYKSVDDMYAAVGFGDRSAHSVASAALALEREKAPPEDPPVPSVAPVTRRKGAASGLSLDGVDDILGKRARCCNPVPGDDVVGFISRGRGITIHRRDCAQVKRHREPERMVEIDWGPSARETFLVDVAIRADDRPGLLRDLSTVVTQSGVDVTAARAEASNKDGTAALRMSLQFGSADQVARLLARLSRFPGVIEVRRVAR
ncbi:MAG: bifunctional (p)ppGpp synthetase/guanosine-3',5'-bis(diphosphate) 3'-pyrophosphohydrolase [Deltaproteobacteria bacterium]|nr:bifunctional (p)ppGpp synthetase/guanosine-3',5'-bis(diphosphate) 3'-pyrophosphohydrolase [Deltaproteobacteria bacterium]MBW2532106.1 bifunctional (p)ppGpp synthetase/guanosine-3',5'-bis(diphosphate) 3'-pyrophosphohydrolase [Deltaproteobacteria bacterium]